MLIALAGLGTPVGAIYFVQKIFPGMSVLMIIFCTAAIVAVLSLIGWAVWKRFSRGWSKGRRKMVQDLTAEGAAPVSMDKREAIKRNNEKFDAAVKNMRTKFSINIFDLPWYIVISDSGTGKTRLIERSDLTFPDGKP